MLLFYFYCCFYRYLGHFATSLTVDHDEYQCFGILYFLGLFFQDPPVIGLPR